VSNFAWAATDVRVSGFGTIGFVTTDSKDFDYRADFSKSCGVFKDEFDLAERTNLGIQLDIIASDQIDFVF
jgi:hypothetical protein